jgi:hypothetical protein
VLHVALLRVRRQHQCGNARACPPPRAYTDCYAEEE